MRKLLQYTKRGVKALLLNLLVWKGLLVNKRERCRRWLNVFVNRDIVVGTIVAAFHSAVCRPCWRTMWQHGMIVHICLAFTLTRRAVPLVATCFGLLFFHCTSTMSCSIVLRHFPLRSKDKEIRNLPDSTVIKIWAYCEISIRAEKYTSGWRKLG